jgi:hypothetical protein
MKTIINKIKENSTQLIQGLFLGLFLTMGIFNIVDGIFFSKIMWQTNCGVNQIIIGAIMSKI